MNRVRATTPPLASSFRVATGAEAHTLHSTASPQAAASEGYSQNPPETWAEAAKRAIGCTPDTQGAQSMPTQAVKPVPEAEYLQ